MVVGISIFQCNLVYKRFALRVMVAQSAYPLMDDKHSPCADALVSLNTHTHVCYDTHCIGLDSLLTLKLADNYTYESRQTIKRLELTNIKKYKYIFEL